MSKAQRTVQRVSRAVLMSTTLLSVVLAPVGAGFAQSLPESGSVSYGDATIAGAGGTLLINQTSGNAIINWNSFSIGAGNGVHFNNGSGATLNRVAGNLPSTINGSLTATGSIYLINAAGIAVGSGGMVRTGGSFVGSTQDLSDAELLRGGDLVLAGSSTAGIVNEGVIASLGGDVVLTARRVENRGTLLAPQGDVGLLAGYEVLLRDLGAEDGKFAVRVGGADTEVVNTGTIAAANAELRANGGNVLALAGNTSGVITATGVQKQGGRIFLTGGDGGTITATQRIVVKPAAPTPQQRPDTAGGVVRISADKVTLGGAIDVSGDDMPGGTIIAVARDQLTLTATASLDASGNVGGLILLGGDYQGGGTANLYWQGNLGTTGTTLVAGGASITANGSAGAGGNVVVWSDNHTSFSGQITATGTSQGGNAEVSGKAALAYSGTADLRSASGRFGTLLLDPYDVIISNAANSGGFSASGNDSVINAGTLNIALRTANVTISTGSGGTQAGDIRVAAPLTWNTASILTLDAYHSIAIDAPITIAGAGGLALLTNQGGSGGNLSFASGVRYTGAPGTGQSLSINGDNYRLLYSMADIEAINTMGLGGRYALVRSLNASGKTYANALIAPGASRIAPSFAGILEGLGNTISRLSIRATASNFGAYGLIGTLSGVVRNIGLIGGSVTVTARANRRFIDVGGLVGYQYGGSISQSYATGAITANEDFATIGGLVGYQDGGSISRSYGTVAVTGLGAFGAVGGLVGGGINNSITQSYATGRVSGRTGLGPASVIGGLVGKAIFSSITQSYATGGVSGHIFVGGLVGQLSSSSVGQSYATGAVTGGGYDDIGGLVGYMSSSSITQSYATGAVRVIGNGELFGAGGLVGKQSGGSISGSYATGVVTARGHRYSVGGLVGILEGGGISHSHATGAVTANGDASSVGGLVGYQNGGSISHSFATGAATATGIQSSADALVGLQNGGTINESYGTGAVRVNGLAPIVRGVPWAEPIRAPQTLERYLALAPLPVIVTVENGTDETASTQDCAVGMIGLACGTLVHPDNRHLGPHITMRSFAP